MKRTLGIVVLVMLISIASAFAADLPTQPATSSSATISASREQQFDQAKSMRAGRGSEADSSLRSELDSSKAVIATLQHEQSEFVDIILWALGVVITVTLLLIGGNYFASFRFHEVEKQALRKEFETRLDEISAKLKSYLGEEKSEILLEINRRLENNRASVDHNIDIVRDESKKAFLDVDGKLSSLSDDQKKLTDSLEDVQQRNYILDAKIARVEELVWDMKDIPFNALLTQGGGLSAALRGKRSYYVTSILERMLKTATKLASMPEEKIPKSLLDNMKNDVSSAAKTDAVLASKVLQMLNNLAVEPD